MGKIEKGKNYSYEKIKEIYKKTANKSVINQIHRFLDEDNFEEALVISMLGFLIVSGIFAEMFEMEEE